MDKIKDTMTKGNTKHLSCLLTMLISLVENDHLRKITGTLQVIFLCVVSHLKFTTLIGIFFIFTDFEPFVELVGLHVQTFITPYLTTKTFEAHSEVIEKVLQLILCTVDGLFSSKNMPVLLRVISEWEPVFEIRSRRYCFIIVIQLLSFCSLLF